MNTVILIAVVLGLYYLYDSGQLNASSLDFTGQSGDGDNFEDPMGNQFSASVITNDPSTWPQGDIAWNVARAIAIAEGYNIPNSNPYRLNNPGDLSDGSQTFGFEPHSGSKVTKFPDAATGWQWLHDKIVRAVNGGSYVYNPDMTWYQIGSKWAPPNAAIWAENVARQLGVDPNSRMGDYFGI